MAVDRTLEDLRRLADLGIEVAHGRVEGVHEVARLRVIGQKIVPVVADW